MADVTADRAVLDAVGHELRGASERFELRRRRSPDFGVASVESAYADASRALTSMADWLRTQTLELAAGLDETGQALLDVDARLAAAA